MGFQCPLPFMWDLSLSFPSPPSLSCCFFFLPHHLCLSAKNQLMFVEVQISWFWQRRWCPVLATGHALSFNWPFTLYLCLMMCLATVVFLFLLFFIRLHYYPEIWIFLIKWTPAEARLEEMSCSQCIQCGTVETEYFWEQQRVPGSRSPQPPIFPYLVSLFPEVVYCAWSC